MKSIVLVMMLSCCYAADSGEKQLKILPVYPVRSIGQSIDVEVHTWDTFNDEYMDQDVECLTSYQTDLQITEKYVLGNKFTVIFKVSFKNVGESGVINATVNVHEESLSRNVFTNLVVLQDQPNIIVVHDQEERKITCVDPATIKANDLKITWIKENETVAQHNEMEVGADDVSANLMCRVITAKAEEHYGSVEATSNAGSATYIRKYISVVSTHRDCSKGGQCNITAHLKSTQPLHMVMRDIDGKLLAQGYPTINVTVNRTDLVHLNISDGSVILYYMNITEETSTGNDTLEGLSSEAKIGIVIGVVFVLIGLALLAVCYFKRKSSTGDEGNTSRRPLNTQNVSPKKGDGDNERGENDAMMQKAGTINE